MERIMAVGCEEIVGLRQRLRWSSYDLAKEIGCNQSTIWRIEHGARFGGVIKKALEKLIAEHPPESPSVDHRDAGTTEAHAA
jgi:DNA-binding XRE family transcriptional regulator